MFWKIKREAKHIYDRITCWVSDKDVWWLTDVIDSFIYEWLKRFKKVNDGHPLCYTEQEYEDILDEMIEGFRLACDFKYNHFETTCDEIKKEMYTKEEMEKIKKAKTLWINNNLWR